ncbi:MAG TPA: hypothetical protein G4O02_08415 [Caldilineae bacterium]|nr:hypothetical protein [Caldilineae bacterium]
MFNKDGGQSAVEFAATFLFFIVLIMTVLDLGRGIYAYTTIAAAAQSGARYGIVNPDDISGIQNAVVRNAIGLDPSNIVVSVSYPTSDVVAVTVRYDFAVITPLLEPMVGNNGVIRLEVTAAMQQY